METRSRDLRRPALEEEGPMAAGDSDPPQREAGLRQPAAEQWVLSTQRAPSKEAVSLPGWLKAAGVKRAGLSGEATFGPALTKGTLG